MLVSFRRESMALEEEVHGGFQSSAAMRTLFRLDHPKASEVIMERCMADCGLQ